MNTCRWLLAAAAAATAITLTAAPALADTTSTSWSGYVTTGSTYTETTGNWTVPVQDCTATPNGETAEWVGLDGDGSSTVEQVGTQTDCADGHPEDYAWWEMWPAYEQPNMTVRPGDAITAAVSTMDAGLTFLLSITDVSTGQHETITQPGTTGLAPVSAEQIVEATSECGNTGACTVQPLAATTPVTFTGTTVTPTGPGSVTGAYDLTNPAYPTAPTATPGPLVAGTFTVTVTPDTPPVTPTPVTPPEPPVAPVPPVTPPAVQTPPATPTALPCVICMARTADVWWHPTAAEDPTWYTTP